VANPFYGNSAVAQGVLASPTIAQSQLLLPYPTYNGVTFNQTPLNRSHYDSGVIRLQKRMGHGLTFLTNVTWMKSTDYNSGPTNLMSGGRGLQNPYNIRAEKGLSEFNVPVLWNLGFTYQLPFGKGKQFAGNSNTALDYIIGGWQFNGTAIVRSGFPAPITQNNYNGQFGFPTERPNGTGISPQTSGSLNSRLNDYYNIAAFQETPALQFGNFGSMLAARGPGYSNFDLSLFKTVPIYERVKAQFRVEALNAFNTPLFYGPNNNVSSPGSFGIITQQANQARMMQLCLRLMW